MNANLPDPPASLGLPETPLKKNLARISLSDEPNPVNSLPTPPPSTAFTKNHDATPQAPSPAYFPSNSQTQTLPCGSTNTQASLGGSKHSKGKGSGEYSSPSVTSISTSTAKTMIPCELPSEDLDTSSIFESSQKANALPSQQIVDKIGDYMVLDRHGKTHAFKSLYTGKNVARRVLVIFVRHFFCGNCQEYLRTLSEAITPDALLGLPISTFIAIVGCGSAELIDAYAAETGCPFPIYTDPTRRLYRELGLCRTLSMGARPAYVRHSLAHTIATGVVQGLRQVKTGLATKSGDQKQVGGEFLFEPFTLLSPTEETEYDRELGPYDDCNENDTDYNGSKRKNKNNRLSVSRKLSVGFNSLGDGTKREEVEREREGIERKRVSWCHRMRTTRDHAEVPELVEVLGLELQGGGVGEGVDMKRWSRAVEQRKGTGLSLASEMSGMSQV